MVTRFNPSLVFRDGFFVLLDCVNIWTLRAITKKQGTYATSPLAKGFLDGYLTMDTIAALNFGIVIALAIKIQLDK